MQDEWENDICIFQRIFYNWSATKIKVFFALEYKKNLTLALILMCF